MTKRSDNYYTPLYLANWAVCYAKNLIAESPHSISMIEPGCGEYYPFVRASANFGIMSYGFDNRVDSYSEPNKLISLYNNTSMFDEEKLSELGINKKYNIIATNPPFSKAEEFVWKCLDMLHDNGVMIFLLKLPFLASKKRRKLFEEKPPNEVFVIQRRPSFIMSGDKVGKTDITEYAFYVWFGDKFNNILKRTGRNNDTILKWLDNTILSGYKSGKDIIPQ